MFKKGSDDTFFAPYKQDNWNCNVQPETVQLLDKNKLKIL
jgi:hypothetical protein